MHTIISSGIKMLTSSCSSDKNTCYKSSKKKIIFFHKDIKYLHINNIYSKILNILHETIFHKSNTEFSNLILIYDIVPHIPFSIVFFFYIYIKI